MTSMKLELLTTDHLSLSKTDLEDELNILENVVRNNGILVDGVDTLVSKIEYFCIKNYLEFAGVSATPGNHTGKYSFLVLKTVGVIRHLEEEMACRNFYMEDDTPTIFNLRLHRSLVIWYEPDDRIKFTINDLIRPRPEICPK